MAGSSYLLLPQPGPDDSSQLPSPRPKGSPTSNSLPGLGPAPARARLPREHGGPGPGGRSAPGGQTHACCLDACLLRGIHRGPRANGSCGPCPRPQAYPARRGKLSEDHRAASTISRSTRDHPVATTRAASARRTSVLAYRLARDHPVPTGLWRRFGPDLAFLGNVGSDLSQGGSACLLAPRMASEYGI